MALWSHNGLAPFLTMWSPAVMHLPLANSLTPIIQQYPQWLIDLLLQPHLFTPPVSKPKNINHLHGDEPPHQIHSYTLLFLIFHYILYIVNPPLCTPALMWPHVITLTLASLDQPHLFDGHMLYNSHGLFIVAPMCTLPWPNQSKILALCGQALTIALLWMSLMLTFLFTIRI